MAEEMGSNPLMDQLIANIEIPGMSSSPPLLALGAENQENSNLEEQGSPPSFVDLMELMEEGVEPIHISADSQIGSFETGSNSTIATSTVVPSRGGTLFLDELIEKYLIKRENPPEHESGLVQTDYTESIYYREFISPYDNRIHDTLQQTFKLTHFRPHQCEAIKATMLNQHIIFNAYPGSGKSCIFYTSAIISEGVTILIVPLVCSALQHALSLQGKVKYISLAGSMDSNQVDRVCTQIVNDREIKIVIITPERLGKSRRVLALFETLHEEQRLVRIVLDGGDAVLLWGLHFRSSFLNLRSLRARFLDVKWSIFASTLEPHQSTFLSEYFTLDHVKVFSGERFRGNIMFTVRDKPLNNYTAKILEIVGKFPNEQGLIFDIKSSNVIKITDALLNQNISARSYHPEVNEKEEHLPQWLRGEIKIIVATECLFGEGVNNLNASFVTHASLPSGIPHLLQQAGRAGRDGNPATSILVYHPKDAMRRMIKLEEDSAVGAITIAIISMIEGVPTPWCHK